MTTNTVYINIDTLEKINIDNMVNFLSQFIPANNIDGLYVYRMNLFLVCDDLKSNLCKIEEIVDVFKHSSFITINILTNDFKNIDDNFKIFCNQNIIVLNYHVMSTEILTTELPLKDKFLKYTLYVDLYDLDYKKIINHISRKYPDGVPYIINLLNLNDDVINNSSLNNIKSYKSFIKSVCDNAISQARREENGFDIDFMETIISNLYYKAIIYDMATDTYVLKYNEPNKNNSKVLNTILDLNKEYGMKYLMSIAKKL